MPDGSVTRRGVTLAYAWLRGNCYRCGAQDVHTAAVGHVTPVGSLTVAVRACLGCTLHLEGERAAAAARYGWPYRTGTGHIRREACDRIR